RQPDRGGAMPVHDTSTEFGGTGSEVPFSSRAKRSIRFDSGTASSKPSSSELRRRSILIPSTKGVESPIPCGYSGATDAARTSATTCSRIAPSESARWAREVNADRSAMASGSEISRTVIGDSLHRHGTTGHGLHGRRLLLSEATRSALGGIDEDDHGLGDRVRLRTV